MTDYRLDQIGHSTFETLVALICQEALGTGTVSFAEGPDGGRDARFTGTAEHYPSRQAPWSGKFVVQAKHTADRNSSCGDKGFFGNKKSIVACEIPRVHALREAGECDHYLLFTNRRLPAGVEERIRREIRAETGVENVAVLGIEAISNFLATRPQLVRAVGLDRMLGPIRFSAYDLRDVIEAFHSTVVPAGTTAPPVDLKLATLDDKNQINGLSDVYFRVIQDRSSPYFGQIRAFLRDPVNSAVAQRYQSVANELNHKVMGRRGDFAAFEQVFEALYDLAIEYAPELKTRAPLVNVFLHFMYWECDLGER
ncbi:MAG: ABC-three component system protein [Longimicrobiales bacterium]